MDESPEPHPPLVDQTVLARLRDQLDPGIYRGFIRDYIGLLPRRFARVDRAVQSTDYEAAMDAVLSLKSSSLMVGASRIGALAGAIESKLKLSGAGTDPKSFTSSPALRALLEGIHDCIAETTDRLEQELPPV
jgi:histidine phosphotransfer protein HptB